MPGPYKLRKVPRKDLYWVVDSTGKHYSKEGLPKEKAHAQQRALYAAEGRGEMHGEGFLGDLYSKAKTAVQRITKVATKGVRENYPPSTRRMLEQLGDGQIVELAVRRDPIQSLLNTALNAITLGKWNEMRQKLSFDKLFHLGLVAKVKKAGRSHNIIIEKNEVINIANAKRPSSDTEFKPVAMPYGPILLSELMKKGEQAKGSAFFLYDAFHNNCQDFILGLLKANDLATEEVSSFVKQPLEDLVKGLPSYTQKIARGVTDLGAAANYVLEGEGSHRKLKELLGGCGLCHLLVGGRTNYYQTRTPEEKARDEAVGLAQYKERQAAQARGLPDPRPGEIGYEKLADGTEVYTKADGSTRTISPSGAVRYEEASMKNTSPCYIVGEDRRRQYLGYKSPEECKAASDAAFASWEAKNRPENVKFFRPAVEGLTKAADFAVDNIASKVGVPKVVTEAYKAFAPPGSKFYKGEGLKGEGVFGDFMSGLKEGFAPAAQVYKTFKALAPLYKLAAKGVVKSFTGRGADVKMSKANFIKEHKKLIAILEAAGKEGEEQKKELAKMMKGSGKASPFKGMLFGMPAKKPVKGSGLKKKRLAFSV